MNDIVERLRSWSNPIASGYEAPAAAQVMREAADEITRLRATLLRISCLIETEAKVDVEVIYDEIRRAFE